MRRLAFAAVLLAAPAAWAAGDYQVGSTEWNGLSRLAEEARTLGCSIVPLTTLDWSTLGPRDALWFVYPRSGIDTGQLGRYLSDGGRAVIADDFGAAQPALEALGIRRGRRPLEAVDRYRDNPNLPVAKRAMATDLGRSTDELVTNHPARLETALPPTFVFSSASGAALVVEGQVGRGRFVALGDPSVLINNMLGIEGNLAFARALVAHTCKSGEHILLFTQAFVSRGQAGGAGSGGSSLADDFSDFARFNRLVSSINQAVVQGTGDGSMFPLVALGVALMGLFAFAGVFPARGRIDFHWNQLRKLLDLGAPNSSTARTHMPGDFAGAAASLRQEALARLEESLGEPLDPNRIAPRELGRRVQARSGLLAAQLASALWRQLGGVRFQSVDGVTVAIDRVTRRQLRRLHATAVALFPLLAERDLPEA